MPPMGNALEPVALRLSKLSGMYMDINHPMVGPTVKVFHMFTHHRPYIEHMLLGEQV